MSTATASTGALSRRGTHPPTGPQTKPFNTTRSPAGRMPIGRVLGLLAGPPGAPLTDVLTSYESLISLDHDRQQPTPPHASGGPDDIATQLPHRPAETGRARPSRRASPACQRSTPSPGGTSTTLGPQPGQRPIPFAGAGDAARAHMSATYPTPGGVDPDELDDQVEEMCDRGL